MGEWQQAIEHLEAGLVIQREIGDRQAISNQLGNLGTVYEKMKEYDKAVNYHREALAVSREIAEYDAQRRHLANLGIVCAEGLNDDAQAYDHLTEAIDLTEQLRGGIIEQTFRAGYFRERLYIYEAIVGVCHRLGRRAKSWEFVERARSRAFLEALGQTAIAPPAVIEPELRGRERKLLLDIHACETQLMNAADDTDRNRIRQERVTLQNELDALLIEVERVAPEYVTLRMGRPLPYTALLSLLDLSD
jgi:hypothetical protein